MERCCLRNIAIGFHTLRYQFNSPQRLNHERKPSYRRVMIVCAVLTSNPKNDA